MMRTPMSYPAQQLRQRRFEWIGRNRKIVALAGALMLVGGVAGSLIMWTLPMPGRLYGLGVIHTLCVAGWLYAINAAFLAHHQDAMFQLRGAWGEDNTRSELQRARRKGLIWGRVDSLELQGGDIDHMVITRRGGVVAIDTKWRSKIVPADRVEMAASARRTALRAEGVLRTVLKREAGARHRGGTTRFPVIPVVALWGAAAEENLTEETVEGVVFLHGQTLVAWLTKLEGYEVPRESAKDVLKHLKRYRSDMSAGDAR